MVVFNRYKHINELFVHYIEVLDNKEVEEIIRTGISSSEQADTLSRFVWAMVAAINDDEENEVEVLGSKDNTEMLPDLNYEITKLMRDTGYYSVWENVSKDEIS